MSVHAREEKGFDIAVDRLDRCGMADKRPKPLNDPLRTRDLRLRNAPSALADCILDEAGDHPSRKFVNDAGLLELRMEVLDFAEDLLDEGNRGADLGQTEEAGAQAVVDVVRIIGDVVGDRGRLPLEARLQAEVQRLQPIVAEDGGRDSVLPVTTGWLAGAVDQWSIVFDESGEGRLRQIEAVEVRITTLELSNDAKRVDVVIEAAVVGHTGVERILARVTERRVPEVVGERDRFGEIVVEPQGAGNRSGDLRDLDGVGQAGAEMVALVV